MTTDATCEPRLGRAMVTAVLGVGAITAMATYGEFAGGVRGWVLWLELAAGVLATGLVLVLFRRPVAGALLLAALALIPTGTPASTVGTLQIARRRPFPVAVGVATVGAATHAVRWLWLPIPGLPFAWWLVLVIIGHGALVGWGALAAARADLIASLHERARRAEAEQGRRVAEARAAERARIAREMHDVLAHRLSLVATYAGALEYRPDAAPERLSQAAGVIRASSHQALEELRDVITLLREDSTDDPARPLPALGDLAGLVEESRAAGSPISLRDTLADPVPGTTGRTAYRVVQEALTNARKHAPGQPVRIALGGTPGTRLSIEVCNPLGTQGSSGIPGTGTGLVGLTERVRLAGGELDHAATPSEFRLRAWLPWPA